MGTIKIYDYKKRSKFKYFSRAQVWLLFEMDAFRDLILALANIAILRIDSSSQYQLSSHTGARSDRQGMLMFKANF